MAFIIIGIITFITAVVSYYFYNWKYWERRGIPHHPGLPFIGSLLDMASYRTPPFLFIRDLAQKYGRVFGITEGLFRTLVISDPDLIQEVFMKQYDNFYGRKLNPVQGDPNKDKRVHLFASHGHRWKRLRTISSPSFSNNSLRKMKDSVEDTVTEIMNYIEKKSDGQNPQFDMLGLYQEFTINIIGKIAMGQTNEKLFENPLMKKVRYIFSERPQRLFISGLMIPPITRAYMKVLMGTKIFGTTPIKDIFMTIEKAVIARKEQREEDEKRGIEIGEPADFIDLFLDAQADIDITAENNQDFTKGTHKVDRHLTVDEIVGQCFVFLLAGYDTTALSLSYSTYLLATHPEIQMKLQAEIDENCPDPSITFDQLSKLKYMECVIKETLRLYPLGALANARRCMKSTKIGEYEIEKGTDILVNTWALHYDPKLWGDDVKEFKPERWEEKDAILKYSNYYMPFGMGPRQCIGMRLAYMEEKLLLSHILRKYSFATGTKTDIPLKLVGRSTTSPESLFLHLNPRY